MNLGVEITKVVSARAPIDGELALSGTVADPVKSHVDGFGPFLFDGVVGKADSSGVVNLHGSGRLRMSKFSKSGAKRDGFLSINIGSSNFGLRSGPHHVFKNFFNDVDGTIGFGDSRVEAGVGKEVMTTNAATGFGGGEIGSIAVYMENHVAGVKPDNSARESCGVVEEVDEGVHGLHSAMGLHSGKVAQGNKKEAIHGKGIV